MRVRPSVLASILMTISCCFGLWQAEKNFSFDDHLEKQVDVLSRELTASKIKTEMMQARFEDFQQEVAMNFPSTKMNQMNQSLRDLASIIPHNRAGVKADDSLSKRMLAQGRDKMMGEKYEEATQDLLGLISRYPDSPSRLEASYLLVRAFYVTGNKQEAINWAEKMLVQFPESLWTAKSLLIMAEILRDQERKNEALDIYQILLATFDDQQIREDVKKSMSTLGL